MLCRLEVFFFPITDIFGLGMNSGGEATLHPDFSSHGMFPYMQQAIVLAQICTTHRVSMCVTEKHVLQRLALLAC